MFRYSRDQLTASAALSVSKVNSKCVHIIQDSDVGWNLTSDYVNGTTWLRVDVLVDLFACSISLIRFLFVERVLDL